MRDYLTPRQRYAIAPRPLSAWPSPFAIESRAIEGVDEYTRFRPRPGNLLPQGQTVAFRCAEFQRAPMRVSVIQPVFVHVLCIAFV